MYSSWAWGLAGAQMDGQIVKSQIIAYINCETTTLYRGAQISAPTAFIFETVSVRLCDVIQQVTPAFSAPVYHMLYFVVQIQWAAGGGRCGSFNIYGESDTLHSTANVPCTADKEVYSKDSC